MIPCTRVLSILSFMKERGKMSLQQRLIQLSLVGMIILSLLAVVYLLAGKRLSKRDPSAPIIRHPVETSPDDALKHWTADKMRNAKPAPMPHVKAPKRKKQHPQGPPPTSDPHHS